MTSDLTFAEVPNEETRRVTSHSLEADRRPVIGDLCGSGVEGAKKEQRRERKKKKKKKRDYSLSCALAEKIDSTYNTLVTFTTISICLLPSPCMSFWSMGRYGG
ncbi:hypothetical protein SAY87_017064 [Trapa incisa]|uniref:Uncharacterized protein n=1 Tax=Trapa incisa TaxID=236973 RepID=A0AAN7L2D5_9MYRT|nr:hypothetical protein SAY87_017064 [Trapa incisa]